MAQTNGNRLKILISAAVVLLIGGITVAVVANLNSDSGQAGTAKLVIESTRFDFGDVSMARGLVKNNFVLKNEGDADLKISNISTSCMCTTVVLEIKGEKSPIFGMPGHGANPAFWSMKLPPGQSANLEVIFDPNAHGPDATGQITRQINFSTNDDGKNNAASALVITANVVK